MYKDSETKEIHPSRFLLYMDVLGTKNLTIPYTDKTLVLMKVIETLSSNRRDCNFHYVKAPNRIYDILSFEPEISNFSDHIAVSFPSSDIFPLNQHSEMCVINSLVSIASQIHRLALEGGILMRGAITKGWLRHIGNNVVGEALVEADYLERNVAKYPRVVISENLVELFSKYVPDFLLRQDIDGFYFIDYLRHFPALLGQGLVVNDVLIPALLHIRNIIKIGLLNPDIFNNPRALENWGWLANKFNESLQYCQKYDSIKQELDQISKFDDINSYN